MNDTAANPMFAYVQHISVMRAIVDRGKHQYGVWVFHSPKNDRRFLLQGNLAFVYSVLLEADITVARYEPEPAAVHAVVDGILRKTTLDVVVTRVDGDQEWWEFKWEQDAAHPRRGRARTQLAAQEAAAKEAGITYVIKTEKELRGKEILFENWVVLCAVLNAARWCAYDHECALILDHLRQYRSCTFGTLFKRFDRDPALIYAAVAKLLQRGIVTAELESELFGMNSVLTRVAP